jgi:Zn-dependent oligopeptidase
LLHDFEKSGINLPEKEREEYVQIHSDIINNQSSLAQSAREPSIFAKD